MTKARDLEKAFIAIDKYHDCTLECEGCPYLVNFLVDTHPFSGSLSFCIFAALEQAVENLKGAGE